MTRNLWALYLCDSPNHDVANFTVIPGRKKKGKLFTLDAETPLNSDPLITTTVIKHKQG